jgi:hypothetical protein
MTVEQWDGMLQRRSETAEFSDRVCHVIRDKLGRGQTPSMAVIDRRYNFSNDTTTVRRQAGNRMDSSLRSE